MLWMRGESEWSTCRNCKSNFRQWDVPVLFEAILKLGLINKSLLMKKFTLFSCFFLGQLFCMAQDTTGLNKFSLWGFGGVIPVSISSTGSMFGVRTGMNAGFNEKYFLTFMYEEHMARQRGEAHLEEVNQVSLLFGISKIRTRRFALIASTGLSYGKSWYMTGLARPSRSWFRDYEYRIEHYAGIPMFVQVLCKGRFTGLSMDFFAYVQKEPLMGISLSAHLGDIKKRRR